MLPYGRGVPASLRGARAPDTARRRIVPALLGAACISSSSIMVRLAHTGAGTAGFYRCALALPVLLPLAVLEQHRHGRRPLARRLMAALAGASLGVDLVLWTHAIYEVGAGIATVLGNLQVLFVTLFAWIVLRERPRVRFLLALPVVLAGVVLTAGLVGDTTKGSHPLPGVAYGVGTSIAYAVFLIVLRRQTRGIPHVAGPLMDATIGAGFSSLVLGLLAGELVFSPGWPSLGWLILLALISQSLGWLLITASLPRIPAALASILLLLQPAATLVLARVILDERPTLVQVGGALLLCRGVLIAARSASSPDAQPEPTPG